MLMAMCLAAYATHHNLFLVHVAARSTMDSAKKFFAVLSHSTSMSIPSQITKTLMGDEEILYNIEKPMTLKAPGLVLTSKRLIQYKPKTFGVELKDYSWRDLNNVSMKEGLVTGEIEFEMKGDHEIKFENLPKSKVREIYALAKEMKEKAHLSSKTVVMQQSVTAPMQEDPVAKLKQLKDMLDAGLISQDEYDKTKAAILAKM